MQLNGRPRARTAAALLGAAVLTLTSCTSPAGPAPSSGESGSLRSPPASSAAGSAGGILQPPSAGTGVGSATGPASGQSAGSAGSMTAAPISSSRTAVSTPTSPEPSGSQAIGTLDSATVTWFTHLCTGMATVQEQPPHPTGSFADRKATWKGYYQNMASAYEQMSTQLAAVPAPHIPSGPQVEQTLTAALPALASAARAAAVTVDDANDDQALKAALSSADDRIRTAYQPLDGLGEVMAAPALQLQLEKIDSCAALIHG